MIMIISIQIVLHKRQYALKETSRPRPVIQYKHRLGRYTNWHLRQSLIMISCQMCCKLQSANVYRWLGQLWYNTLSKETTDKKNNLFRVIWQICEEKRKKKKTGIMPKWLFLMPDFTTYSRGAWSEPSLSCVNQRQKKISIHPSTIYGVVLAPTSDQNRYKPISKQARQVQNNFFCRISKK